MNEPDHTECSFLAGGGEMGARIRAYDWATSPLDGPEQWPPGLKTAVRLLLSSGHPMVIWWGPHLIQFYNDAYSRSLGIERHPSALGQSGRECWAEIWDVIEPQITAVMQGGYTWHENQLVPVTRNGRRENVYWTYSYTPIDAPEAATGIGGVLVICVETTAQVVAEQRLAAAEARWRDLFWQAPGFMCILNGPDHVFEFANPSYFELIGQRNIVGRPVREALPEVVGQGFESLLDQVYRSGKASRHVAQPVTLVSDEDGAERLLYLDYVYQPIQDANGRVSGIFVDGYDVTERVRSSESLLEEDRRKDEFLAMLAHELRNPLAPIRNAGELLLRLPRIDPEVRAIGDLIQRQTVQLTRLVDDLLDISRITQGRIELHQASVDLRQVIDSALESLQGLMQKKQHQLSYQRPHTPVYVHGDMARLIQCVANITANAIKFTPPKGHLQVSLQTRDGHALLEVRDDGVGIPPSMLPRVFDLFVQVEQSLDRSHGGLGIGLSIVQRLVQMHGGQITAHSKGPGEGTRFQIRLPLEEAPVDNATPEERAEPGRMRILVVDDNVDAANSLEQLLALQGHRTAAAYNAVEALSMVETFAADIVLLDIGLPDIDGYEVARRMRTADSERRLIAVTGYGQARDVQLALEAGFDAHLTKPVTLNELESLMSQWG